ncbi:hypothetical protein [Microbacterium sp. NPDC087665]|uniref:hypothetical protein n=1 Tax=Microbacterium sp. NPDC087665 TaxID=3364194 RepID=UPI0038233420
MTTSDQHDQGPLTRKQLREIRLTGSTPVITEDTVAPAPQAPPVPAAPPAPREAEPVEADRAPVRDADVDPGAAPLTRRQARDQERVRTASVPIIDPAAANAAVDEPAPAADEAPTADAEAADVVAPEAEVVEAEVVEADVTEVVEAEVVEAETVEAEVVEPEIVSGVPDFASADAADDDDDDSDDEVVIAPVSASSASTSVGDVPLDVVDETVTHEASEQLVETEQVDDVDLVLGLDTSDDDSDVDSDDVLADVDSADDDVVEPDERPTVNPAFGQSLLADDPKPFTPSFDDLLTVGDSNGSQHTSPSALIYTPSHGEGSLSGPVASTGEILVTGSYELPRGIGSQGHADGVADGKDIDAVLIDGELAPASSPTPIAASAAVSTLKPTGEVIRPPAPEKGNRLMLILAIVAGGLALALGVVLVVAFTTNVF